VKQEFIPSNVDEAEFEVNVNGPEGTNLAVMNETMQAIEKDILSTQGREYGLVKCRRIVSGAGVNQGNVYVRHRTRTRSARFSLGRLWTETRRGHPLERVQGKLFAAGP